MRGNEEVRNVENEAGTFEEIDKIRKQEPAPSSSGGRKRSSITWQQVRQHRSHDNAWVVYKKKVYDVSRFYDHPGGAVIFTCTGEDITDVFAAFHLPNSFLRMQRFYIGDLAGEGDQEESEEEKKRREHQASFETAYRRLHERLLKMGLFEPPRYYYVYKFSTTLLLGAFSVFLLLRSESTIVHFLAANLLGLFFQQSGWMSHDLLHHQVFSNRRKGDAWALFWTNLLQGYSVQWWKNKHSCHHAITNLEDSAPGIQDGDPDLDTMPLLAWSLKQVKNYLNLQKETEPSAVVKLFMKYQAYTYFPVLLLARLSWLNESFKVAFELGGPCQNAVLEIERFGLAYPKMEKIGIILHYIWVFAVVSCLGQWPFLYSCWIFMVATASCGIFLAIVFSLGHNAMALHDAGQTPRIDYFRLQASTCRHVCTGSGLTKVFLDWFNGAFQQHIDHHLYPTMPRPNLRKAHPLIKSFFKEWDIPYHETDMIGGILEVLHYLDQVGAESISEFASYGPTAM